MSLRARLTIALLLLVATGLLIADVVTYRSLRSFLVQRVDEQLTGLEVPVAFGLSAPFGPDHPGPGPGSGPDIATNSIPTGTYGAVLDPTGAVQAELTETTTTEAAAPTPVLPDLAARVAAAGGTPFTVAASRGSGRYRVEITRLRSGEMLVVALPLDDVDATAGRLVAIEAIASLGVLGAMALVARRVVRLGLKPLEEMQATADAIAAGDLTRRVDRDDDRTEVGRLGQSLNAMLGQIETSFSAQQASEARLRRFVADASHELRTPLTSIRGYAELFRRGAASRPHDLANAMLRIEQESERMSVLVDDLLLLARLDQGRPLERAPVDVASLALEAIADARVVEPHRSIEWDGDEPAMVIGDEQRLRQVVGNLLANVRQHTPVDASVTVSVHRENGHVVLAVTDDGPGLRAEQAARVFERFYRADPSRSHGGAQGSGAGTGLGLSIVSAITEAHGGHASVSSTPGHGARFEIDLPAAP